jgi:Na+-driven multidrug efflux pump
MKGSNRNTDKAKAPQTIELSSVLCVLLFLSLLFSFAIFFISFFCSNFFLAFALLIFFSQERAHNNKPQKKLSSIE